MSRWVPPAVDSVGVNSKEQWFKLMLEVKEVFFIILVSLVVTISKTLFVHFNKCCRSSKFFFNEQEFMWNRENNLVLSENFRDSSWSIS